MTRISGRRACDGIELGARVDLLGGYSPTTVTDARLDAPVSYG
jgi:hypothetical protein